MQISTIRYNRQHLQYNSNHGIRYCWWVQGDKLWRHSIYFNVAFFKEAWSRQFCWDQCCINADLSNFERLKKRSKNVCKIYQNLSVSLDITKLTNYGEKMLILVELLECVMWFIYIFDLLYVSYNWVEFIIVEYL